MKRLKMLTIAVSLLLVSFSYAGVAVQSAKAQKKIDILFVIDNSASMQEFQINLVSQLRSMAYKLSNYNLDFRIGVTTTDSHMLSSKHLRLRDGAGGRHSDVFVVTPTTPEFVEVLTTNLLQGSIGDGYEAPFRSFREVLDFPGNRDFRRADAELAIIAIGDEDDDTIAWKPVVPVIDYYNYLRAISNGNKVSFSAITKLDLSCQNSMNTPVASRMMELVDLTKGYKGSVCSMESSIAGFMDFIGKGYDTPPTYLIKLDRNPIIETIVVKVNGVLVKKDDQNGWSYVSESNSLKLNGSAIPKKDESVSVHYDYVE